MRDYLFSNAASFARSSSMTESFSAMVVSFSAIMASFSAATFAASAAAFSAASAAAFSAASSREPRGRRATGTGKMDFFLSLWLLFCLYFTSNRPVPGEYFPDCIFFKIVSAPDVSKSLIHFVNDAGEEVYLPCIFPGRFEMASFDISVSASICKYGLGR